MKTLKILAIVLFMMIQYQNSYSYFISYGYPCINPTFPSPHFYPNGTVSVNFKFDSVHVTDSKFGRCRIYTVQNGIEVLMYDEVRESGIYLSIPINTMNFPNLGYNEPVQIKIVVTSIWFPFIPFTKSGYVIIYKGGMSNKYGSISNGSSELMHTGFVTFISSADCKTLATANYYIKRYKITFTLQGNFTDSVPEVVPEYCMTYSGAGPNSQERWGFKISQTGDQAMFIGFVYHVTNTLGQDVGYWPIDPQRATIVYQYNRRPVITSVLQYPAFFSQQYNVGFFYSNLLQPSDSTDYIWTNANNNNNHQFSCIGSNCRYYLMHANLSNYMLNSIDERTEWLSVTVRACNSLGCSDSVKKRVLFGSNPHGCPYFGVTLGPDTLLENSILIDSPDNPGKDVTDFLMSECPLFKKGDSIKFSIIESGEDKTMIDELSITQIQAPYGKEVGVTNEGTVVTYTPNKLENKFLYNGKDVTTKLKFNDNETVDLKKDDELEIDCSLNKGGEFILLRIGAPAVKSNDAAVITTSNGEMKRIRSRSIPSNIVIKIDKKPFNSFKLIALQPFTVDQIDVVQNENLHSAKKLPLIDAFNNETKIGKLTAYSDGSYAFVTKGNPATFIYENNENTELNSSYLLSFTGRYEPYSGDGNDSKKDASEKFEFKLSDNHPNPFNPVTKIKFEIPEAGLVKLTVYDISGREIKTLVNEIRTAGIYETEFDGGELASGVYFYKLHTGGNSSTKRMILIK